MNNIKATIMIRKIFPLLIPPVVIILGCSATPGPDKSATGAVLGAAWGAGAGAVVGNQLNRTGPGAMLGSAFGAGAGLMTGIGLDIAEGSELEQERELESLKMQVSANRAMLFEVQDVLDKHGVLRVPQPSSYDIFFDENRAAIRLGAAEELERLAQSVGTAMHSAQPNLFV